MEKPEIVDREIAFGAVGGAENRTDSFATRRNRRKIPKVGNSLGGVERGARPVDPARKGRYGW